MRSESEIRKKIKKLESEWLEARVADVPPLMCTSEEGIDLLNWVLGDEDEDGEDFMFDQEKMVDFFLLSKKEFLLSYNYLTNGDYEATVKEVIKASGYYNPGACEDFDGRELRDIVLGCMMTKVLCDRRREQDASEFMG